MIYVINLEIKMLIFDYFIPIFQVITYSISHSTLIIDKCLIKYNVKENQKPREIELDTISPFLLY